MNFLTNYCHHPTKVSTLNLSLSFLTQHISDRIVRLPSLTFLHNFVAVFRTFGWKNFLGRLCTVDANFSRRSPSISSFFLSRYHDGPRERERERKHRSGLIEVLRKAQRHQTRLTSGADKISGYLPFIAKAQNRSFLKCMAPFCLMSNNAFTIYIRKISRLKVAI